MQRFAARHRGFREMLRAAVRCAGRAHPGPGGRFCRAPLADRRLLHARVLGRGRGAVQSVDRAGAGPERCRDRLDALHHEPASRGRGTSSSIEFRTGVLDADAGITIDDPGATSGRRAAHAARPLQEDALRHEAARARRRQRPLVECHESACRPIHARRARGIARRPRGPRPAARRLVRDGEDHSHARARRIT